MKWWSYQSNTHPDSLGIPFCNVSLPVTDVQVSCFELWNIRGSRLLMMPGKAPWSFSECLGVPSNPLEDLPKHVLVCQDIDSQQGAKADSSWVYSRIADSSSGSQTWHWKYIASIHDVPLKPRDFPMQTTCFSFKEPGFSHENTSIWLRDVLQHLPRRTALVPSSVEFSKVLSFSVASPSIWLIFVMILWFGGQLKLWLSNCESVWKQDSCQKAGKVPFLKQLKGFVRAAILFKVPWKGFRLHLTTFLGGSKSRGPSQHPCSERRVPRFPPSACQEI